MRPLYKTTIVIWSEYDGTQVELSRLGREAEQGDAYCSRSRSERVEDPAADADWDDTEFFGADDDEPGEDTDEYGFPWADRCRVEDPCPNRPGCDH